MKIEKFEAKKAINSLIGYWDTYDLQHNTDEYAWQTVLHDALYGIGISLDHEYYNAGDGYERFQVDLIRELLKNDRIRRQVFVDVLKGDDSNG